MGVMSNGIGGYISRRRDETGVTQTAFAERVGLKRSHLSLIESGKIALPSADVRRRLADALGIRHVDLLVIAGELAPEEVATVAEQSPTDNPYVAEFIELLPYVDEIVMGALRRMTVGTNVHAASNRLRQSG